MNAIMKNKASSSTSSRMQNNKEQEEINRKHKRICFEVRATALRPRLHHYEGFPLNSQRKLSHRNLTPKGLQLVYTRLGFPTPTILSSHKRNHNSKEYMSLGDLERPQTLSYNFLWSGV